MLGVPESRIYANMQRFIGLQLKTFREAANVRGSVEGLDSRQEDLNPAWVGLAVAWAKTEIGPSQQTWMYLCTCESGETVGLFLTEVLDCLHTFTKHLQGVM